MNKFLNYHFFKYTIFKFPNEWLKLRMFRDKLLNFKKLKSSRISWKNKKNQNLVEFWRKPSNFEKSFYFKQRFQTIRNFQIFLKTFKVFENYWKFKIFYQILKNVFKLWNTNKFLKKILNSKMMFLIFWENCQFIENCQLRFIF